MKRHLHRDYNAAECGRDAAHIPMTYELAETTCAACRKALPARLKAEADAEKKRIAEAAKEEAKRAKAAEEHQQALEDRLVARLAAMRDGV